MLTIFTAGPACGSSGLMPPSGIPKRLLQARLRRGLTQAEVARAVGTTQAMVGKIERGAVRKSKHQTAMIAFLGLDKLPGKPRHIPVYFTSPAVLDRDTSPLIMTEQPEATIDLHDPKWLQHYHILYVGRRMIPLLNPGDQVKCDPSLRPRIGQEAAFFRHSKWGREVYVRMVVEEREDEWVVRQYTPLEDHVLPKSEWREAHRVVGRLHRK